MSEIKTGFIRSEFKETDKVLGGVLSLPQEILQPNGQWLDFIPLTEPQHRAIETCNCTAYGSLHQLAIYMKRKFGGNWDFSERYLGIASKTRPPGTSPAIVYDALRHYGTIHEEELPFNDQILTVEAYYSPDPLSYDLIRLGEDWLDEYDFGYEYVFTGGTIAEKQARIKEALTHSPVSVSVVAWIQTGELYVKPYGSQDQHWTTIVGYEEGFWWCFDSYSPYMKKLDINFDFEEARKIHVEKRAEPTKPIFWVWLSDIIMSFNRLFPKNVIPQPALSTQLSTSNNSIVNLPQNPNVKPMPPVKVIDIKPNSSLETMNKELPQQKPMNKIQQCAKAIESHEGYYKGSRSFRNCNPGNLRFANQMGCIGQDKDGFARFPDYQTGFNALVHQLENAASGKSKVYSPTMTLYKFFALFAPSTDNNNPVHYAEVVAQSLGVLPTIQIKELLV